MESPEIINRTPHAIALVGTDGKTRIIEKSGSPVRIETSPGACLGHVFTIPIHAPPTVVRLSNLPIRRENAIYVVSQIAAMGVAAFHPDRDDIVYPGTGPKDGARRANQQILSATQLIRAV